MKFRQNEEPRISNELKEGFINLIQFEINKMSFLNSACCYFDEQSLCYYKVFFSKIADCCEKTKSCLIEFIAQNGIDIPQFIIPAAIKFDDKKTPFEQLVKYENEYESYLENLMDIAFENRNWKVFAYILNKLSKMNRVASKALAAVNNNSTTLPSL